MSCTFRITGFSCGGNYYDTVQLRVILSRRRESVLDFRLGDKRRDIFLELEARPVHRTKFAQTE
jgi:hypothetical protein